MLSTNINEKLELRENGDLKYLENGIDIGENNEEIKVKNQRIEENKNFKNRKQPAKSKRNLNPIPTECSICERMASGYIFYGVICCDGIDLNV
uniref:Nuclear receptor domain-containing protein n=1 Tax=Meloidogyne floridensis TaxID=298350 RepID=A0A915NC65_9BILA